MLPRGVSKVPFAEHPIGDQGLDMIRVSGPEYGKSLAQLTIEERIDCHFAQWPDIQP